MSSAVMSPTSATTTQTQVENYEFDPSLSEDEKRFYIKAYPSIDLVRERKVHCTVCKCHIGTAPAQESNIKMHPILRVTHCIKCHDFYNSGEFSKGEDGSELYCRWCGQGGEVYCCSNCPYVFCKSCIVKNLSRGVVADIEQNENWSCFSCAPKILWPLRAQHWALINYIDKQKKFLNSKNFSEIEIKQDMNKDRSTCCRLAKSKCGNMSDSLESLDSVTSRRSLGSSGSSKKTHKLSGSAIHSPAPKRPKTSNDEVVCTPDLLSMLEPDCQITVSPKPRVISSSAASIPKVLSIQASFEPPVTKSNAPPPLVLRNTAIQMRPIANNPLVRRTIVGPRTPAPNTPVYHTINGFRVDLNSAAQQETFRLPNGKLIQVKRQGTQQTIGNSNNNWQQRPTVPQQPQIVRPIHITQSAPPLNLQNISMQPSVAHQPQSILRYQNTVVGNTTVTPILNNATQIQVINGTTSAPVQQTPATVRPLMVKHIFPDTAIGQARSQLQDQVFNAMEICTHLTGKVQTLTNSNAYKQARNYLEIKELYIHLSYLLTYGIGRFKGLQDKCLADMRQLGFVNDADSLENGQLAAGAEYVRFSQLEDVDLFSSGSNSFHNLIYEYRKTFQVDFENIESATHDVFTQQSLTNKNGTLDGYDEKKWQLENTVKLINENGIEDIDDNEHMVGNYVDPLVEDEQQNEAEDLVEDYNENKYDSDDQTMNLNNEDYLNREKEAHAYDRKLTCFIAQYPSIWCTRHPDYGNFDVTRKQWRKIASHFKRTDNIKLRWKNIRKRFVRIERRVREGKRFNGYFDKATNFLANRDLQMSDWIEVDLGDADNDNDCIEQKQFEASQNPLSFQATKIVSTKELENQKQIKPIEIQPLDMKIINFVKSNPVLWRKSSDPYCNKVDEQTRKSLWMHLWKSMTGLKFEDIIDRWTHLYEMYKVFRLKTIKSESYLANLELKYSKYLAKLYFLYKISEDDLERENMSFAEYDKLLNYPEMEVKLQSMKDDKEFLKDLLRLVKQSPSLWHKSHADYYDLILREQVWSEIAEKLKDYNRDISSIKLRWHLAKFNYYRLVRDRCKFSKDEFDHKLCKNLPYKEMTFLDFETNAISRF